MVIIKYQKIICRIRPTNRYQGSKERQGKRQQENNKRGIARYLLYCSRRKTRTARKPKQTKRRLTSLQ